MASMHLREPQTGLLISIEKAETYRGFAFETLAAEQKGRDCVKYWIVVMVQTISSVLAPQRSP